MQWEMLLRLVVAGLCGALIGFERKSRLKEAGLRTHFVVAVGSALIMIVSKYGFMDLLDVSQRISIDPSRIAAQVVSGIGFLGAGTIIVQRQSVRGLTTAAGLWSTAGIGLAIGAGMYLIGFGGTVLILLGLEIFDRGLSFIIRRKPKLLVEINDVAGAMQSIVSLVEETGGKVTQILVAAREKDCASRHLELTVRLSRFSDAERLLLALQSIDGLVSAEIVS